MPHNDMPHPHPRPIFRFPRPVIIAQPVAPVVCRTVTDNQTTIDALQGLLENCRRLAIQNRAACSPSFVASVQQELNQQIAIGVVVGRDCSSVRPAPSVLLGPSVLTRY